VHLKGLYRFARDEGYPVLQDWLPSLPAAERAVASAALNRKLSEQDAAPADVGRIRLSLEDYLRTRTEILVP